ncbi:DUF2306 domain-containing protein [uncultured Roseibium sp.]|uniref:DUF2306 domain-containing protein n=1 Tax=uncultured Roseibium sp. TaxID=1936171 RepID=UPI00260FA3DB|nr:DUF2306 domain-containing protein [uncultured Roseibium sp.]
MRPVLIGFTKNCAITLQSAAPRQNVLQVIAILLLLFCLVFAAFMAWKMIFYIAWQFGAQVQDSFPLVYETSMFLKMAAAHPKLPFFAHGIAGTVAMVSGAIQFLAILCGVKSRWHAVLGKIYAVSAIIASTTAIPLAWSLHHDMLLTSIAYTAGAIGWCLSTLIAVHTIMSGDLERHIAWIIRSYSYLAMVVTARLLLASGALAGSGEWNFEMIKLQYAVTIVATFFINWGLGEWIVATVRERRRKTLARSVSSLPVARPMPDAAYAIQTSSRSRQPYPTIAGRTRVLGIGA